MAFLYYEKKNGILTETGKPYSLAGYNLVYRLWESRGKPTNQGWHVSADDMIKIYSGGNDTHKTAALIIDFDPNSKRRIGLIELLDIYVYTYTSSSSGQHSDESEWSPMMLRLRDVMYEKYDKELTHAEKKTKIREIQDPNNNDDFVEFLYLHGTDRGWNWGMNGMTNAAFIQGPARQYFKQYF